VQVWLAEGLLMYLEPQAVEALTAKLFKLSAPNSQLLVRCQTMPSPVASPYKTI
jgi:O-methyltransferase involved in polyketide biosynthesis